MSQPPPPPPDDQLNSHDHANPLQQTPSTNHAASTATPLLIPKTRTPRPGTVKMPTPPTYRRTPSSSGQDRDFTHGYGPSSRLTPGSEGAPSTPGGLMSPSISNSTAFVFPLRSVFQNQNKSQSSQGNDGKATGMQRSISGRQLASPNQNHSDDLLAGDAGIDTIQQLLEQSSSEHRERKQPSGNPGVATFSGKVQRSGSTASQVTGQDDITPQKPASAGNPPRDSGGDPSGGFFSMPPSLALKEPSQSPFFEDPLARRSSISNGQIGRATSKKPERPKPETRTSGSDSTARLNDFNERDRKTPVNPSTTAEGSGLPDPDRAPVGQPQGPVNEVNFRHRPGGDSVDAATSFSSRRPGPSSTSITTTTRKDADESQSTSTTRLADLIVQQKRQAIQADLKQSQVQNLGDRSMPGLSGSDGSGSRKHLELDEHGEHQLIQDFSEIVRLGGPSSSLDEKSKTSGSAGRTGSGPATGSRGQDSATGSSRSSAPPGRRTSRHNNNRDATQTSVLDFVESQSHTENMADPNAPTSKQAASTASQEAQEMQTDTPPPRPSSSSAMRRPNVPLDGYRSSKQTDSSAASAQAPDSSEAASASGAESTDDDYSEGTEEEDPVITLRFEHTQNTDGHHVVVGREGILRRCEDEPITTPGAVQGFGVLMVLEEEYETGDLVVRQVSEVSHFPKLRYSEVLMMQNATELLGLSPKYLFRLSCFSRILTTEQEDLLRDNLEYLPDPQDTDTGRQGVAEEGPQVFLLSGYGEPGSEEQEEDDANDDDTSKSAGSRRREWTCWVAAHRPAQPSWNKVNEDGHAIDAPDLIVLEFELERDLYNPLTQPFDTQNPQSESSARSGAGTPDSASQTASLSSRRSMPGRSHSHSSGGQDSTGSATTVGTTPRPAFLGSDSGTATGKTGTMSDGTTKKDSRSSSRFDQALGLDGLDIEMPLERIIESTTNHAKPLRALERMRGTGQYSAESGDHFGSGTGSGSSKRQRGSRPTRRGGRAPAGSTGAMDVFAVLGQINEQLGSATDLEHFLKVCVGVVQNLCRFHRVVLYQFDENYNGQVVAELVEWGKTTDLFKGLMFPAADIPAQARQLYAVNKVRLLYDRSQTTARMVLRNKDDLEHPLDMTHCYLRAMSPIHIKCECRQVTGDRDELIRRSTEYECASINVGLCYGFWSALGSDRLSWLWTSRHASLVPRQADDAITVRLDLQEHREIELCSAIAY